MTTSRRRLPTTSNFFVFVYEANSDQFRWNFLPLESGAFSEALTLLQSCINKNAETIKLGHLCTKPMHKTIVATANWFRAQFVTAFRPGSFKLRLPLEVVQKRCELALTHPVYRSAREISIISTIYDVSTDLHTAQKDDKGVYFQAALGSRYKSRSFPNFTCFLVALLTFK